MKNYDLTKDIICISLTILANITISFVGSSLYEKPKQISYAFENKPNNNNKLISTFLDDP